MSLDDAVTLTVVLNAVVKDEQQRQMLANELGCMFPVIHWRVDEDGLEAS